jgi:hypothetical protein
MVLLGTAPSGQDNMAAPYNHSEYATFDDGMLSAGAALYAGLALPRLASASAHDGPEGTA